ncbi:MAG: SCO family protein [Pseudomonadota bacterium]
MKKKIRPQQLGLAALTAVVALGVMLSLPMFKAAHQLTPISGLGGPFTLTNQMGERVSDKTFLGRPTLYFFGFTHCPDVCPTTLLELSQIVKEFGKDRLNAVFISVDPARDTPNVLRNYLQSFEGVTGLTGSPAEIESVIKAFHVYAKKQEPSSSKVYNVDHTASVFAANAKGDIVMTIGYGEAPDMIKEKINRLLNN